MPGKNQSGRLPSFIIAGTQKGGTTWLEHNLNSHPQICTPRRQLHFFDRHYDRGLEWYRAQFADCTDAPCLGEKTTEYLDTFRCEEMAARIARDLPEVKLIFMLRDPVDRAFSAVQHMVNSGLELPPDDVEALLHDDAARPDSSSFRYLARGLYARQLEIYRRHISPERIRCLVLEEDVRQEPETSWHQICAFLGVEQLPVQNLQSPVNRLRLSRPALHLSRWLYNVPRARGMIRRLDGVLPLRKWELQPRPGAKHRIASYYQADIARVEEMLDRPLDCWKSAQP
jgi:Sulfotransferase domain